MSIEDLPGLMTALKASTIKMSYYYNWLASQNKLGEKEQCEILTASNIIRRLGEDITNAAQQHDWNCMEYAIELAREWNEQLLKWLAERRQGLDSPPPFIKWELHRLPTRFSAIEPREPAQGPEEFAENPEEPSLLSLRVRAQDAKNRLSMFWAYARGIIDKYGIAEEIPPDDYEYFVDLYYDAISSWDRAEYIIRWGGAETPKNVERVRKLYQTFIDDAISVIDGLRPYLPFRYPPRFESNLDA